jgi:hypothetical protein
MSTSQQHETAQIIPFPGRAQRTGQRAVDSRVSIEQSLPGVARVACGGNWYHDAAVEEAIRATKR